MILEEPTIDVHAPITPEAAKEASKAGGVYSDDPALQLVIQDAERAENFESTKQWVLGWVQSSVLYQSPYSARYWDGTQIERANIPFYTVATAVNSLTPQIVSGLFSEDPPFLVQPRPGTRPQAARAVGAILGYQLEETDEYGRNFREELRLGVVNAILSGTGIWSFRWETYTRERKIYRRKDTSVTIPNSTPGADPIEIEETEPEIEEEIVTEYTDRPVLENITNPRYILVDPGLNVPDIQKAKYIVHRRYLTYKDLDRLRDRPGFNIPSKDKLIELFAPPKEEADASTVEDQMRNAMWDGRSEFRWVPTTADPMQQPLEVLERWDKDTVIIVLQKKLVICNDKNEYGVIPYFSCNWWDIPEGFWGMGLSKTIGAEQRLQQGITNVWLDNATLNLNGVYVRVRGKNVPTQSIRIAPGKIVDVDEKDGFQPLKRLDPVPEAGEHLSLSQARAEKVSGSSDPLSQGVSGSSGHSNLARTAAGANMLAAGATSRSSDFVEKLANQVIVRFLYLAHEMNRALLPASTIRYILSEELKHEYMNNEVDDKGNVTHKGGDIIELLNARVKLSIVAAAKMQARRSMAQALPVLVQFLTAPEFTEQLALQGKKIDIQEVIHMFFQVSDWKNEASVVVDMTEEDKQRYQQMMQAKGAGRSQAQLELEGVKHKNKKDLIDQENMARAGRDILKNAIEDAAQAEGGLGGPAFGSEV